MSARPRLRRVARAALALAAVLVALVLVELGARGLLAPPLFRPGVQLDAELGHRSLPRERIETYDERGPFAFQLNSEGFRGPELPRAAAPEGTSRLAFFGDSFLFGRAVRDEERVDAVTARLLFERGLPIEAFNLGVPDYGTLQELLLLERLGSRLAPDVVVLLVFPGNDVANNALALCAKTPGNDGDLVRPYLGAGDAAPRYAHPWRAALRRRSRAFAWLELELSKRAARTPDALPDAPLDPREHARADEPILRAPEPGSSWDGAWRDTEALLVRFRDAVRALGAELLVVIVPRRTQVQHEGFGEELRAAGAYEGLDWNYPERRLGAFLAQAEIPVVAMLADLRAAIAAEPTPVFANDFHLTGRAHALIARRVADWVERRALPSEEPAGAPVDLLAPERCLAALDFVGAPRFEFLDLGFGAWRLDWAGKGPGIALGRDARLYLRAGAGDFVVRGLAAGRESQPLELQLELDGVPLARGFSLAIKGPFEWTVPRAELPAALQDRVTVRLRLGGGDERAGPALVVLRQIGFSEALATSAAAGVTGR